MQITAVNIEKILNGGKLKAFIDLDFGGIFVIRGFAVVKHPKGMAVFPPRKEIVGGFADIIVFKDEQFQKVASRAVLEAFVKYGGVINGN